MHKEVEAVPPFSSFKNFETERLIHSIKTALACLAGVALIKFVGPPMDQWLIITIAVVMCAQINVGSVFIKSYMRFLGTLTGSILAAITIALFGTEIIAVSVTIALSAIIFSYIATSTKSYSDSGTLGAVTVIVILLGQHPTITTAFHRFLEISVGILIAALVSQFILPIRARDHIRRSQAETIEQLRSFYIYSLIEEPDADIIAKYQALDEDIVKSLSEQRTLSIEALSEPFGASFNLDQFTQILRCEKEVFRSMVCMQYAYKMLPEGREFLAKLPSVLAFHEAMCIAFQKISICIKQRDFSHTVVTIPSLHPIKHALQELRHHLSNDDLVYVNGFLFCAEILIVHLTQLVILLEQARGTHTHDH